MKNILIILLAILIFLVCWTRRKNPVVIVVSDKKKLFPKEEPKIESIDLPPLANKVRAYSPGQGPYPGKPLNVPVPKGALKESSEEYGYPFYRLYRPLKPYDYFRPYGPNQRLKDIVVSDRSIYDSQRVGHADGLPTTEYPEEVLPKDFTPAGNIPFYSSASPFAPFPEIYSPWEKVGVLTTVDPQDDTILELYRRPIAPLQDLFEYSIQDKNGFILQLRGKDFLETGDIIPSVLGKESKGPWKVTQFIENKWVWA